MSKLPSYSLCLNIGIKDFQVCVVNKQTNACLLLEDYRLENIKTIVSRLELIAHIITKHKALASDQWDDIKLSFKGHKFTLVPSSHFLPEISSDYLVLNSEIKTKIEEVYYYKHITTTAVNIFACDTKVINWMKEKYPNKNIQVIHQGSALIEGILKYDDHSAEKSMFCFIDRGLIHVICCQNHELIYYNQFAAKTPEEYLKYMMLVFKELEMSPKTNNLTVWGHVKSDSPQMDLIKKYIKNVSFGSKPKFMKFSGEFDDAEDHKYFDAFSIFLCE